MKFLMLAAALSLASPGLCLAQTSAPTTNPSAHSKPSTSPNGPAGSSMMEQGQAKPCANQASGTSDRMGGSGHTSAASGGADSNPSGKVGTGAC